MIYLYAAAAYIFFVFVVSRLVIPHLGFKEDKIPDALPKTMAERIKELNSRAGSAEQFLNLTYDYLGAKGRSERFNTIFKFSHLFKSLEQAWQTEGYLPCTINNYLLKIFLVKSGRFKAEDIRRRHVFVNFVPHQYLQVRVNNKWLDVDVGERQKGLPIGKHLKYFG